MAKLAAPSPLYRFGEDLRAKAEIVRPIWADFSMAKIWWRELEFLSSLYGMQLEEMIEIATSLYPHEDKAEAVEAYLFACLRARARLADKPHTLSPLSYGFHARASRVPAAEPAQETKRVLLVDDDSDALRLAEVILLKSGFEVVTARTGDAALALLAAGEPSVDALVTDHAMPGLSGLILVELALEQRPDLPALIITGYGRDAELERLPAHVGVLTKPFAGAEFVLRVSQLIRVRASTLGGPA